MAAKGKKQWICAGCGANVKSGEFFFLCDRKEELICRDCFAALQIKYPMYAERNPEYCPSLRLNGSGIDLPYIDVYSVQKLTANQVKQELATIDAYREQLRDSFGGAENVFEIRLVHALPGFNPFRVNFPNAMRYKNSIAVYGYVRLGTFHKGDIVEICHGDITHDTTVLLIRGSRTSERQDPLFEFRNPDSDNCFRFEKEGISEGFPAIMLLPQDAVGIEPGDRIIAD